MEADVERFFLSSSSYKQRRLALALSAVKQVALVTDDTCATAHVS